MSQNGFEKLNEVMRRYRSSMVFLAAYELGVLDKLGCRSLTIANLKEELEISEKGLTRLLSSLCAMGIAIEDNKNYKLSTEYEKYLNPQSIHYIGGLINHEIHLQKRWAQLSESVKSGNPIKKSEQSPNHMNTNRFIQAMANLGQRTAPLLIEKLNFSGNEHLLDLGGGPGKYLEKFCEAYPKMQITLFDQNDTILAAKSYLEGTRYYKNMKFIGGDFLQNDIGEDYDIIFSSNVIHIFGPEDLQAIFNKCYNALKTGGRLLIKDFFLNDDHKGPEFTTLFSLHMLLSTDEGGCYSEKEMISLMESAHFSYKKTLNLTESSRVIEAIK